MSSLPHLAQRLYNAPLLITPAKAEVIEAVFRAHVEGRALPNLELEAKAVEARETAVRHELAAAGFKRNDQGGYLVSPRGVALIPILGSLMQRAGGMDAMSGLEGYNRIGAKLDAALADPNVRGILLEVDSPGGEANGAFDLAGRILGAAQQKPVWAIANEQAFSAAYLLASAASELYVPESGMVGSVGVIMMHVDQSAADAKKGLVYTPIYAGARKADFSQHAPLSDVARASAQAEVDRVYEMFVQAVAKGRRIEANVVRGTEAGLLDPATAQGLKMIDGVRSFGETLSAFESEASMPRRSYFLAAAAAPTEGVSTMAGETGKPAADNAAKVYTQAELDQAASAARSLALKEGEGAADKAAEAATARIAAILDHPEAEGRSKLARHLAFKTTTSADAAAELLKAAAKEDGKPANPLAAAMERHPNPHVGTTAPGSEDPKVRKFETSEQLFARRRREAGHAR